MLTLLLPPALDLATVDTVAAALDRACADAGEPVVLRGSAGTFCTGLDPAAIGAARPDDVAAAVARFGEIVIGLLDAPVPTLALVDGDARGGGLGLAAACDVVVATDRSRLALPELLLGMLPAVIYPALRERMTPQRLRAWVLTGDARSAAEAAADGLVDEVVATDALDAAARRWTRRLSRVPSAGVAALRRLTREDRRGRDGVTHGVGLTTAALADAGTRAALARFAGDGVPPWEAV